MDLARSTVDRLIGMDFEYKGKQPRETILDSDEEYAFVEASEENRDLTAAELARDNDLNPKGVSASTVERILNNHDLKCRIKRAV